MHITHSYVGTTLGGMRCHFFLLFEDYIEAQRGLSGAIRDELERFARNLGNAGAVVMPFPGDADATRRHILDKPWSESQRKELMKTPSILMIDKDFDAFDPQSHSWVLFHFDRSHDPEYAAKLRSLLQKLSDAVTTTEVDAFALIDKARRLDVVANASKSFHLRPGVFGVSIDLRVAWAALKEFLRGSKSRGV